MKLPSGRDVNKEQLVEMCETVAMEKLVMECTFTEAFELASEDNWPGLPALDKADISYLHEALKDVVIDCEAALRSTLGTFMAENETVKSW